MVTNMIVDLTGPSSGLAGEADVLAKTGTTLLRRRGAAGEEADWVKRTFNPRWAREATFGWNWFAKSADGRTVGFACYEQRTVRFWWVRRWLKKSDVGFFGPIGVDSSLRGNGLGCLLVRRALASLRELGYARAIIPHVASETFYERCCSARVVERLKFLGVF